MKASTTSHIFHFILTLATGGAWIIIWILCACLTSRSNSKKEMEIQSEMLAHLRKMQ